MNFQTDSLVNLTPALIKAQLKMGVAEKSRKAGSGAKQWKYADLPAMIEASRKPLADNKLCVVQPIVYIDGVMVLRSVIIHESGEYMQSLMPLHILPAATAQDIGSRITYFKRYAYAALIGLIVDEEDDDGAKDKEAHRRQAEAPKPVEPKVVERTILSDREIAVLEYELRDAPEIIPSIFRKYSIDSIRDLPYGNYEAVLAGIREIKRRKA